MNISDYRYRIELHAHTSPVSGCSQIPPAQLVQTYHDLGCHAVAITNHFTPGLLSDRTPEQALEYYMNDFRLTKAEGDRLGVNILLGFELRFTESNNDYLIFGVDEADAAEFLTVLDKGVENFVKNVKKPRHFFAQAHPYRSGITVIDPAWMDGVESYNVHPGHNSRIAVGSRFARENHLIELCGTDYHHPTHEGLGLTLAKTLPADSMELADLLRTGDFLFRVGGSVVIPNQLL